MKPRQLFDKLADQVSALSTLGQAQETQGQIESSASIYRACIVLSVSALDAYMHEKAAEAFLIAIRQGASATNASIDSYLQIQSSLFNQTQLASSVRYRLSFKTLVTPQAIDKAIDASGSDARAVWRAIGEARGSRESRLRNMLDLQVDRRNQIAHEADWDPAQLAFRRISLDHVTDCTECITSVVHNLDACWI
ncbi:hypothetical protein BDK92_1734 [Micromonospora pisi]|uniref:RiboL-PSP-HEPN domain-containing protein n=1 Tax=Micromonospora pisi TaxID=589240 RepID=A0A495JFX1_9ACTN|nr:hypothetical protein BDK92_1734 [Micromonospora pisi]